MPYFVPKKFSQEVRTKAADPVTCDTDLWNKHDAVWMLTAHLSDRSDQTDRTDRSDIYIISDRLVRYNRNIRFIRYDSIKVYYIYACKFS